MLVGQAQFVTVFINEFDVEEMICVWGFDSTGDFFETSESIAHSAFDAFASRLMPVMTNQYHMVRCEMQIRLAGGVQESEWSEDISGDIGQDAVPQNTAYLIHKQTLGLGVGRNGRCYLPGVREDNVSSGGRLEGSWPDTVSDSVSQLLTDFNGVDLPELVVNRGLRVDPSDPPPRVPHVVPAPLFYEIKGLFCDVVVCTQRRRLRR